MASGSTMRPSGPDTYKPTDMDQALGESTYIDSVVGQTGLIGAGKATGKSLYDTRNDAATGKIDARIKALNQYDPNSDAGKAAQPELAKLQQARSYLNGLRWQSTVGSNNQGLGFQALSNAVSSGKITWDEVGKNIDISQINDDAALASAVDSLVKSKATPGAAAAANAPTTPDPATKDATDAANALTGDWNGALTYVQSQLGDQSVQGFDQAEGQKTAAVSGLGQASVSTMGTAGASAAATNAGSQLTEQGQVQRQAAAQGEQTSLEKYLGDVLSRDVDSNAALTNMDSQHKTEIQGQAADKLLEEIKNNIGTGNAEADAQLKGLETAINDWKTAEAGSDAEHQKWMSVVKLIAGAAMTAGGVALTATGAGAPVGGALIAGGIGVGASGASGL